MCRIWAIHALLSLLAVLHCCALCQILMIIIQFVYYCLLTLRYDCVSLPDIHARMQCGKARLHCYHTIQTAPITTLLLCHATGNPANHSGMTPYIFLPRPASHAPPHPTHAPTTNTSHTAALNPSDEDPSLVRFRFPLSSTTLDDIERDILRILPLQSPTPPHTARPTMRDTASSPSPPLPTLPANNPDTCHVPGPSHSVLDHHKLHTTAMLGDGLYADGDAVAAVAALSSPGDAVRRAASVALALSRLEDQDRGQGGSGGGGVDPVRQRWAPWELERQMQDSVRRCVCMAIRALMTQHGSQ